MLLKLYMINKRWADTMIINLNFFLLFNLAYNQMVNEVIDLSFGFAFFLSETCFASNYLNVKINGSIKF